jgi:hypothetical protein
MILALALNLALAQEPVATETLKASDYFPAIAGAKYRYLNKQGDETAESTEIVLEKTDFGDEKAVPIRTLLNGREITRLFYRITEDTVYVLGSDDKEGRINPPMPILKVSSKPLTWEYTGRDANVLTTIKYSVKPGKPREILGAMRDVLELTVEGEAKVGNSVKFTQKAVYAKGIGLVEMTDQQHGKNAPPKRTVNIQSYELPEDK